MNYYVLIAMHTEFEPFTQSTEIVAVLGRNSFWLASQFTPFRKQYAAGDRVILYAAGRKARCFVGDATVSGPVSDATEDEVALGESLGLVGFAQRIPLTSVRLWDKPVLIKPMVNDLDFIKDKHNYGLNLRLAAARISAEDYQRILDAAGHR